MSTRLFPILAALSIATFTALSPVQAKDKDVGGGGGGFVDAPTCSGFPDNVDELTCACPKGFEQGSVWGSGPYTSDSNICTAAYHAGVIGDWDSYVLVVRREGQDSYPGSTSYGITTSTWGSYGSSFDVYTIDAPVQGGGGFSSLPECNIMPSDTEYYACSCAPNAPTQTIWGSDPYTADSDICTSARHAGIIGEEGGDVFVLAIQGLEAYRGSLFNGVDSSDWSSYHSSITFDWN